MQRRTFVFNTTVVIQEVDTTDDIDNLYRHRLVIGAFASEWAGFSFLAYITLGDRTFMSCIDGRAIFPPVFEVVSGLEKV